MADQTLAEALREDLHRLRMTKNAFAAALGISVTAINKWSEIPDRWMGPIRGLLGAESEAVRLSLRLKLGRLGKDMIEQQAPVQLEAEAKAAAAMATEPAKPPLRLNLTRPELPGMKMHRRFVAALPEHLRQYADKRFSYGSRTRVIDYCSPNIGVEVKLAQVSPNGIANVNLLVPSAAMQLQIARAILPTHDDFLWLIAVVVPPGPEGSGRTSQSFSSLHADLGLLGLDLMFAETPEGVARYISDLEDAIANAVPPEDFDENDPRWEA